MSRGSPIGGAYVEVGADISGLKAGMAAARAETEATSTAMGSKFEIIKEHLHGIHFLLRNIFLPLHLIHAFERLTDWIIKARENSQKLFDTMSEGRDHLRDITASDERRLGILQQQESMSDAQVRRMNEQLQVANDLDERLKKIEETWNATHKGARKGGFREELQDINSEAAKAVEGARNVAAARIAAMDRAAQYEDAKRQKDEQDKKDERAQHWADEERRIRDAQEEQQKRDAEKAEREYKAAKDREKEFAQAIENAIDRGMRAMLDEQREFYNRFLHVPTDLRRLNFNLQRGGQ